MSDCQFHSKQGDHFAVRWRPTAGGGLLLVASEAGDAPLLSDMLGAVTEKTAALPSVSLPGATRECAEELAKRLDEIGHTATFVGIAIGDSFVEVTTAGDFRTDVFIQGEPVWTSRAHVRGLDPRPGTTVRPEDDPFKHVVSRWLGGSSSAPPETLRWSVRSPFDVLVQSFGLYTYALKRPDLRRARELLSSETEQVHGLLAHLSSTGPAG